MVIKYEEVENVLDAYALIDVLHLNDLTEVDALYFLVQQGQVKLPDPRPL